MKNQIKTYQEFERRLHNESIPTSTFDDAIVDSVIHHKKRQKPTYAKVSVIIIFFSVFLTASFATAMELTGWRLFNNEGKEVLTIDTMTEEEAAPHLEMDKIMSKYQVVIKNLESELPRGKFIYFLDVEAYEKFGITSVRLFQKEQQIKSIDQLPQDISNSFYLSDDLLGENSLFEGSINYEHPDEPMEEKEQRYKAMYEEAKQRNVPYIVAQGDLTQQFSSLSLTYKHEQYSTQITFSPSVSMILNNPKIDNDYRKITEQGIEFLYNASYHQLTFVKEEGAKKFVVSINGSRLLNEEPDPEELMVIARKLLEW